MAALNIVSGLIMLVKNKDSDIAILRTMGASQGAITRTFMITGASMGVAGTLVGLVVGLLVCVNIESIRQFMSWLTRTDLFRRKLYFLSKLPAEIDLVETAAVVTMALTLSFVARSTHRGALRGSIPLRLYDSEASHGSKAREATWW